MKQTETLKQTDETVTRLKFTATDQINRVLISDHHH